MSLRRDYSPLAILVVAALTASCSAAVNADPNSLPPPPGSDGGRTDGGQRDATVPPTDGGGLCVGGCDDGVECTADACGASGCTHTPNDGFCEGSERCSVLMGCIAQLCASDAACSDGLFCNGVERCNSGAAGADPATGCLPGTAPRCFDDFSCTTDFCDEGSDSCVYEPNDAACSDGVSCTIDACDPATSTAASGCVARTDSGLCAGACATIGPAAAVRPGVCGAGTTGCTLGAPVLCDDGNACTVDTCDASACGARPVDADSDGFLPQSVGGTACGGDDCNDGSGAVHPGATELCNSVDDNCNGTVDEGCTTSLPDNCATAAALTASGGGVFTATGSFASLADDYVTTCGSAMGGVGGHDAVYYFDLTALSDVVITTNGGTLDTVLGVGTECSAAGFGLGCDDDITSSNTSSRIFLHRFGPGFGTASLRVYVLVDAYNARVTGDFTVTATVTAATADSCTAPINITGGGTLVGEIGFPMGPGGLHGSCQPMTDWIDPEGVASYTGSADGTEGFYARAATFNPTLYVREAMCSSDASERVCVLGTVAGSGGTATLNAMTASTTTGYLFIDNGASRGRYSVDYTP